VKNTLTPTVIPPLGELDIKGVDMFRYTDSIIRVRELFKASPFVHNVLRYLPDRVRTKDKQYHSLLGIVVYYLLDIKSKQPT